MKKVRRVGNGWLGRAATRRRMRSHNHGYVGSERALGVEQSELISRLDTFATKKRKA